MKINVTDLMSGKTDEELIEIVTTERDGYLPQAVEAAEVEIKNRAISSEIIEEVKNNLQRKLADKKTFETNTVSVWKRAIHFIVDTLAFIIMGLLLAMIIGIFFDAALPSDLGFLGYLYMFMVYFIYYTFMESKYQKTIGKFITKTKVVTLNGSRPTSADITRRTLLRLTPFDRISFLFTPNGFHDKLSDTRVIND